MIEVLINILKSLHDSFGVGGLVPTKRKADVKYDYAWNFPVHLNCRCHQAPLIPEDYIVETGDGRHWPIKKELSKYNCSCVVCFNVECSCKK